MTMTETKTYKKTNTKLFQDPMYAIFFKSRGFKDLRYYIACLLVTTKTKTKTKSKSKPNTNTQFYAFLGGDIFQR